MNANRENFKAIALELLGLEQARLTAKERRDLYDVAFGQIPFTAALGAAINRIAERVRGVVA